MRCSYPSKSDPNTLPKLPHGPPKRCWTVVRDSYGSISIQYGLFDRRKDAIAYAKNLAKDRLKNYPNVFSYFHIVQVITTNADRGPKAGQK
jgi:hypothetical protein